MWLKERSPLENTPVSDVEGTEKVVTPTSKEGTGESEASIFLNSTSRQEEDFSIPSVIF